MKSTLPKVVTILAALSAGAASADTVISHTLPETGHKVNAFITVGTTMGGDNIGGYRAQGRAVSPAGGSGVFYDDVYPNDNFSTELNAGDSYFIGLGIDSRSEQNPYGVSVLLSKHFNSESGSYSLIDDSGSSEQEFNKTSISIIPFYVLSDKMDIGAGLVFEDQMSLETTTAGVSDELEVNTANGWTVRYRYMFMDKLSVTINYTDIKYTIQPALIRYNRVSEQRAYFDEKRFDGNNVGLSMSYYF